MRYGWWPIFAKLACSTVPPAPTAGLALKYPEELNAADKSGVSEQVISLLKGAVPGTRVPLASDQTPTHRVRPWAGQS
jgi:hypothetical protein